MCEALSKYVRQFLALMRKNLLLKSRMWLSTILEIALPFIVILGLVGIHAATTSSYKEPASYDGLPPLVYPSGVPIPNARALSDSKLFSYNQSVYDFFDRILVPLNMRLSFIPNSGVGAAAADAFARTYPFAANYMHNIFGSEGQMEDYVSGKNYNRDSSNPGIYGAIVFKSDGTTNGIWDYNLRFNASSDYQATVNTQDKSDFTDDLTLDFSSEDMNLYLFRGFAAVQGFVETFMINRTAAALGRNSTLVPSFQVTPFPTVGHKTDDFAKTVAGFLGLLFTLVYIWPVLRVAKVIIEEKELRIKEAMKIMGLSESALWVSWLMTYFLISLITTCLILAVTSSNIYKYSNKGYIFLLYLFFGMAAFSFAYMISAFFSRARVGATVAGILFLIIYFPYSAMTKSTSVGTKGLACLSAPIAFTYGVSIVSYWESYQQGVTASNAATIEQNVNFSFSTALGMLFFDIVFYLLLGLYFDAVVPSKYGVSKPACFCFSSLFSWMKKKRRSPPGSVVVPSGDHAIDMKGKNADAVNNFEPVSEEVAKRVGVRALHLHKEFESDTGTGPVVAVNDFTLDMYEGQIFALLGHNGAGKTTVINMLTGMYGPTSGEAIIAGLSISNDLDDIRRNVGVCPQHDVLFDMLTVKEHLELFARIKGIPSAEIENEVMTMIADVGLTEKVHSKSAVLSGGQKRKLSVAIALLGGSKIVFLDEPTSGMDPYSRRSTWELLRKGKQNRVIILTTHFMDEADQLGDRIAIMAKGDVRCCGSPLFLKARYGVGYTLTLSKEVQIGAAQQEDKQRAQNEKLNQLVFSYVPRADILSEAAGEVAYRLPFDSTPQFAPLFRDLDSKLDKLGLQSYGISVTTLEEVFLRVGRDGDAEITSQRKPLIKKQGSWGDAAGDQPQNDFNASPDVVTPGMSETNLTNHNATLGAVETEEPSPWRHFKALIVKRWINSKRDRKVWFWQCLYPGIILLIGLGLLKASLTNVFPGFTMSTSGFNSPLYVPYNLGSSVSPNPFPLLGPNIYPPASNIRALGVSGLTSPRNMSNYLLANYLGQYKESKYLAYYYDTNGLTMFFNGSAIHGVPVVMNVYHNLLLQSVTGTSTASINLYNKAMPLTSSQLSLFRTFAAIFIGIAMAFIPSSIVAMVVREKETKAKHQQLISGVDVNAYWLSTYVWDVLNFIFPGFILIIILLIYQIDELIGENIGASIVITLLYALSVPSFTYMMSFFFTNHVTAQNMMLVFYIFTGPILLVASVILDIISSTQSANKVLKYFYRLFPHFCVGEAFTNLISRQSILVYPDRPGPFAMDVTGKPLLYMGMEALGFFLIVLFIELVARTPTLKLFFEFGRSAVPKVQAEEDPDILQEKERVTNNSAEGLSNDSADVVQVRGLRKVYPPRIGSPPKVAVHDLWFGIPAGECFGFLGINGAGKTTTLQMLTGDELPTEGTAFLNGLDVLRQQKSIRRFVGYCPQFDALIDTLTARELLTMYCHIKGVRESSIPAYVESIIKQLSLSDFADKPCAGYSGGNKRKLSVGVALVGNPRIVFLDEPSTGMDPKSRRFLWDLISATMAGRSVILTTHSMEECEALCSRMGIMVGGRLRCLGSAQHLKHRYGDGYQIDLNAGANSTEAAVKFIMERVPGTYIIENHRNFSKLRVPKDATMVFPDEEKTEVAHQKLTLASLFEMMDRHHANLQISEYSISETTLEQIFIHFARQQEEETGAVAGFQSASPHQHNSPPAVAK